MLTAARILEARARERCESSCPSQIAVLLEEVGEVCDALANGTDATGELVQVAAMAAEMAGALDA